MRDPRTLLLAALFLSTGLTPAGECVDQIQNYTGGGTVAVPGFDAGEQAGSIFTLPAGEFPIEILKIGIGWGSQFGGNPDQLERSIKVFEGGLPNPGLPIFQLNGPVLTDGAINVFDVEILPGDIIVNSAPFTVTLELDQDSVQFGPAPVHDGNGCQFGKNVLFAPGLGGWLDPCGIGLSGDWVFFVEYRSLACAGGGGPGSIPDGNAVFGVPLQLSRVGTQVTLHWSSSCSTDDTDYGIYRGIIPAYYSHFAVTCTTGSLTQYSPAPFPADEYFLVVPTDEIDEGSYGRDSGGFERPQGGGACSTQSVTCP